MRKLLLVTALLLLVYLVSSLKIRNIYCFTQFGDCSETHVQYLNKYRNKWFFTKITNPFPPNLVRSFGSQKRFPDKLVVKIHIRRPAVSLSDKLGADEDGVVLTIDSPELFPRLHLSYQPSIHQRLSPSATKAVDALASISRALYTNLTADLSDNRLDIQYKNTQIILDTNFLDGQRLNALQMLLDRSKIDGKVPKIIDLRFSQPVVTY